MNLRILAVVLLIGMGAALAESTPKEDAEMRAALAALKADRPHEAERRFQALTASGDALIATAAYEALAHIYQHEGRFRDAVAAYDQAIAKDAASPVDINYDYGTAGMASVLADQYAVAYAHLDRWHATLLPGQDDTTGPYLFFFAIAQVETRRFSDAQTTIDRVVKARPSSATRAIQKAIIEANTAPNAYKIGTVAGMLPRDRRPSLN